MFTTGNHGYLYASVIFYLLALVACAVKKNRIGNGFLVTGFVVNSLYLLGRGWIGGIFIINPLVEGPYLLPWCLALVAFVMGMTGKRGQFKVVVTLLLMFAFFSLLYARGMLPPAPQKMSGWATIFFVSEGLAQACFYCGAAYACIFLWHRKDDSLFHTFIIWGFIFYSVAQVTGAIWCYLGWGNTFRWGSRHLSSATIWIIYAAYLHLKFLKGWSAQRRAVFTVLAAVLAAFISYGGYLHEMTMRRIGG